MKKKIVAIVVAIALVIGGVVAGLMIKSKRSVETMAPANGLSAYELAVNAGYSGSLQDWLNSLSGKSAYELAKENGYSGTEKEWISALSDLVNHPAQDIKSASFSDNGDLLITLGDNTVINVGAAKGKTGANGADGISVASGKINDEGNLVLTLSNGKAFNVGKVVGTKGDTGAQGICQNCNSQLEDNAIFCPNCGANVTNANGAYNNSYVKQPQYYNAQQNETNQYDHTSEFEEKDISENKVTAMLIYLLGAFGIIIALLAAQRSPYTEFHLRQGLKFVAVNAILYVMLFLFCWTVIVPFFCLVMYVILCVVKIICFFQICSGKAKEPAIIRSLGFLK